MDRVYCFLVILWFHPLSYHFIFLILLFCLCAICYSLYALSHSFLWIYWDSNLSVSFAFIVIAPLPRVSIRFKYTTYNLPLFCYWIQKYFQKLTRWHIQTITQNSLFKKAGKIQESQYFPELEQWNFCD